MFEFLPKFRHLLALSVITLVCGLLAVYVTGTYRVVFGLAAAAFALMSWAWIYMLIAEARHRRYMAEQEAERANLAEFNHTVEALAKLPPLTQIQMIAKRFPGYGFETVHIPAEGVQTHERDGWTLAREIPGGLATPEQYQRLAADYFDKTHSLPIRYYTEYMDGKGNPIFGRKQFERILAELVRAELAVKDPVSGEVSLNTYGEQWLRRYYQPPLPHNDGFTPITR